jgi:hypothetical protein
MTAVARMDFELNRVRAGTFKVMVTHARGRLLPALAVCALAALGCGSKTTTVTAPLSMDADFSVCSGTPGVHYAPGIGVLSASGAYRATIEAASLDQDAGAPVSTVAIGYDTFTVTVASVTDGGVGADAGSPPPDGLTMTTPAIPASVPADPFMPQHGHGAATVPTITPQGGGQFSVAKIDFFMGGYWQLYLDLTPPGGAADRLTFEICIPTD